MKAFISYSSKDKPIARRVADEIRQRGHNVWLDERDLSPGQPLALTLSESLEDVDVFVIIITQNSVASKWVSFELNQAISIIIGSGKRILPLKFDVVEMPAVLTGFIYADCTDRGGLRRALNLTFISARLSLPLSEEEIDQRFKERVTPEYCVRLIPSSHLAHGMSLGPTERRYVPVADYFEQCGRPLRDVLENLFVGKYLEDHIEPDGEWSALIVEAGALYEKKLDLFPGTWKAVYRIVTDRRRLQKHSGARVQKKLEPPPRDYWEVGGDFHNLSLEALQSGGVSRSQAEDYLAATLGIFSMCFTGNGRGPSGSRIFFARNLSLQDTRHWVVNLGRPSDGNVLT